MQGNPVQNLYEFFSKNLGTKLENFQNKENELLHKLREGFSSNNSFNICTAKGLLFELCEWPPLVERTFPEVLDSMIPWEVVNEFIPLLFSYLDYKFPGDYKYDDYRLKIRMVKNKL